MSEVKQILGQNILPFMSISSPGIKVGHSLPSSCVFVSEFSQRPERSLSIPLILPCTSATPTSRQVGSVLPDKCKVMDSKKKPVRVEFVNADPLGSNLREMFKVQCFNRPNQAINQSERVIWVK